MQTYSLHVIPLLTSLAWYRCETCKSPLHLTPLIDVGNIAAALELSEVKDPLAIIPKSYAGFITTNRLARNHLFFWFFPSLNDTNAPLVIWLNGGPAVSSMFGLLYENGPIRIRHEQSGRVSYERRPNSWADPFSMLYIDNPVGTGFSYSETNSSKTKQDEYSEELYVFLEQFYLVFPVYLSRELYIGGQSYAGKYVPAFAHRIHTRILAGKSQIPLTGIYLGGPYFDPLIQSAKFCEIHYSLGVISHAQLEKCKQEVVNLTVLLNDEFNNNLTFSDLLYMNFAVEIHKVPPWDNLATLEIPHTDTVDELMKTKAMQIMLHVCNLGFTAYDGLFAHTFTDDFLVSTKSKMAVLMNSYKVLLYTGDYDGIVTSPMVEAALMTTPWARQEEYNNSVRSVWKLGNNLRGFYTHTGQFCRVVIHRAGHQTPHDQPEPTLDMMIDFVRDGCIQEND